MNIPKEKESFLNNIINELKQIDGVKALVLGGSHATGMATENSDLDIGIYYSTKKPFNLDEIKSVAQMFSDIENPTVTGFYEWGPWVNGGAWLKTSNGKVDFLYKNIEQISTTIDKAKNGIWENHFEQQPPYGFSSIIFLAETKYNIPLYDPEYIIENLKKEVEEYPQKLKQSVIQQSLWSAEFTFWQAEGFASKEDIYNTLGCLTRAIKNIVTTLFAINQLYPMGDKRAIAIIEQSNIKPANLTKKLNTILCCNPNSLIDNVKQLKALFDETVKLANGLYKPYYKLW